MNPIPYIHDGSQNPPRLAVYLNLGSLTDLPPWSQGPRGDPAEVMAAVKEAGFEGVQGGDADTARAAGLAIAGGARLNTPVDLPELEAAARAQKDRGCVAITIHAGWGMEDDAVIDALVEGVIDISSRVGVPIYIETHRATITQDIQRTVKLVERHGGVRFNADFSHWYTGLEMRYGGAETKMDFFAPVLERVGFMHGRIGNPGCMQVDVGDTLEDALSRSYVQHFAEMWTRSMAGFLRHAGPGDVLVFAPELLQPAIFYARTFPDPDGQPREEGDRWQQCLLYAELARRCFEDARQRV